MPTEISSSNADIISGLLSLFGDKRLNIGTDNPFVVREDLTAPQSRTYSAPLTALISTKSAENINRKVKDLLTADFTEDELRLERIDDFVSHSEARIVISISGSIPNAFGDEGAFLRFTAKLLIRCSDDPGIWIIPTNTRYERDFDSAAPFRKIYAHTEGFMNIDAINGFKHEIAGYISPKNIQNRLNYMLKQYAEAPFGTDIRKKKNERLFPGLLGMSIPKVLTPGSSFAFGYDTSGCRITWTVLERNENKALCMASNLFTSTWNGRDSRDSTTWGDSFLRKYLNSTYLSQGGLLVNSCNASRIVPVELETHTTSDAFYNPPVGNIVKTEKTTDKAFVLSADKFAEHYRTALALDGPSARYTEFWVRTLHSLHDGTVHGRYFRSPRSDTTWFGDSYLYGRDKAVPCMVFTTD